MMKLRDTSFMLGVYDGVPLATSVKNGCQQSMSIFNISFLTSLTSSRYTRSTDPKGVDGSQSAVHRQRCMLNNSIADKFDKFDEFDKGEPA